MTRYGWIVVLGMVVVGLGGCATEQTQTRRQTSPDDDEQQSAPIEARGNGGGAIPQEQMEEITQILDRKRQDVAHCWTNEATRQHNRTLTIDLMLRLTIGTGGRAQTVEIVKNSVNSKEFDECVVTMVKNFEFP